MPERQNNPKYHVRSPQIEIVGQIEPTFYRTGIQSDILNVLIAKIYHISQSESSHRIRIGPPSCNQNLTHHYPATTFIKIPLHNLLKIIPLQRKQP